MEMSEGSAQFEHSLSSGKAGEKLFLILSKSAQFEQSVLTTVLKLSTRSSTRDLGLGPNTDPNLAPGQGSYFGGTDGNFGEVEGHAPDARTLFQFPDPSLVRTAPRAKNHGGVCA